MLNILTQAPATVDPGDRALDDPAPWQDHKAFLVLLAPHNLDADAKRFSRPFDQLTRVALVGPALRDARTQIIGFAQHTLGAVAILHVGGLHRYGQQVA